ncbi:MAG TPA: enoyl-ACP reductase, partial [Candidatus Udaeobacter sp.]|nr:enoyl-ACP reductase [Candidatus Udaeobacter sp.]
MDLLQGKTGLVVGVANERSLAWGIARALHGAGARLAFTYQGEPFEKRVRPLAEQLDSPLLESCDITDEDQVQRVIDRCREVLGGLDLLVHAVAYADKSTLQGDYLEVSKSQFLQAMEVSAYSLTALCRIARPILRPGAGVVTLTYMGAERVVPNYNVMGVAKAALEASVRYLANDLGPAGVRVNAISAGPVKTLSASAVSDLSSMLKRTAERAPLRRNIDLDDVGRAAVFL